MPKIMTRLFCLLFGTNFYVALLAQGAKAPTPSKGSKLGTEFEFEGTTVKGERTTPMASILEQANPDQNYDFVTIRQNWREEILESAESLDTKGSSLHLRNDE